MLDIGASSCLRYVVNMWWKGLRRLHLITRVLSKLHGKVEAGKLLVFMEYPWPQKIIYPILGKKFILGFSLYIKMKLYVSQLKLCALCRGNGITLMAWRKTPVPPLLIRGCKVSCGGHHRPRGKTTTGSALDGAVFDIAQILAYLVHNMSRSQLYLGFGHFGWLPSFFGQ